MRKTPRIVDLGILKESFNSVNVVDSRPHSHWKYRNHSSDHHGALPFHHPGKVTIATTPTKESSKNMETKPVLAFTAPLPVLLGVAVGCGSDFVGVVCSCALTAAPVPIVCSMRKKPWFPLTHSLLYRLSPGLSDAALADNFHPVQYGGEFLCAWIVFCRSFSTVYWWPCLTIGLRLYCAMKKAFSDYKALKWSPWSLCTFHRTYSISSDCVLVKL